MKNDKNNNILLWVIILAFSIVLVGLSFYLNAKKIAKANEAVYTYIVYNYDYAYYYDNKVWNKIDDMSFVNQKEFNVYSSNSYFKTLSASINKYTRKLIYNDGTSQYTNLVGISSNKTVFVNKYNAEILSNEDLNFVKSYLSNKKQTYIEGQTEVIMYKLDIDADLILEKIFQIYYKVNSNCYNYILIKDGENTEIVLSYSALESEIKYKKASISLIIDADLNEKKEFLIIEKGYEYSKLLLYANQYGTYSLVE